jgi:hypothetical protein
MMSAQIVPFAPGRNKAAQPASLHRMGLQEFSHACRKLAESLRDLTVATRDAAAKLHVANDGADIHQLDRPHAQFVRHGKR